MAIRPYSTRANQERRENPNRLRTWRTASGGVVTQFWGMRIYCGRCRDCSGPVTCRRNVSARNWGSTNVGRWPLLCDSCRNRNTTQRSERHSDAARVRMARLRAERRAFRDEQFAKAGLPPVRQGVSQGLKGPKYSSYAVDAAMDELSAQSRGVYDPYENRDDME